MDVTLPTSLDRTTLTELCTALEAADGPFVLRGSTDTFCTGLSLEVDGEAELVDLFVRCVRAIRCGPPVLALVEGAARGAGVGLAAAADRVLATPSATFALTEIWFGLVPAAIWPLLAERVRPSEIRWLAMTGRSIDAVEANGLGLVDAVVDGPEAASSVFSELRRACPEAIGFLKGTTAPMGAVAVGAERTLQRLSRPTVRHRIQRFLDGEVPWD